MENIYIVQLFAILLAGAGLLGLVLSGEIYGQKMTRDEARYRDRQTGSDWENKGTVYKLPFRLETLVAAGLLLGGIFILTATKFEVCGFLAYWLPTLPQGIRLMLTCR